MSEKKKILLNVFSLKEYDFEHVDVEHYIL